MKQTILAGGFLLFEAMLASVVLCIFIGIMTCATAKMTSMYNGSQHVNKALELAIKGFENLMGTAQWNCKGDRLYSSRFQFHPESCQLSGIPLGCTRHFLKNLHLATIEISWKEKLKGSHKKVFLQTWLKTI